MLTGGVTSVLSVKELEQLGYKIVVCPIESLMVCARAMRDLCDAWKSSGRVTSWLPQAMSFAEVKELLGVEEFLKLRALRVSRERGNRSTVAHRGAPRFPSLLGGLNPLLGSIFRPFHGVALGNFHQGSNLRFWSMRPT
jgi:hypothetical protein